MFYSILSAFGRTFFCGHSINSPLTNLNPPLTATLRSQRPVFLTSVNAEELKQVDYEKSRIIDIVAGFTGNSKSGA
jgi:hypothetical protein